MTTENFEDLGPTFLLNWDPREYDWPDRQDAIQALAEGGAWKGRWPVGNRRQEFGWNDSALVLRQGVEPRGIVASGIVESEPYEAPHWDGTPGKVTYYVDVYWTGVVDDEHVLPTPLMEQEVPTTNWSTPAGGNRIESPDDAKVWRLWDQYSVKPSVYAEHMFRPPAPRTQVRVWCIWSSKRKQGQENFAYGLSTSSWGLPARPKGDTPVPGDFIVFGTQLSGPNVRLSADQWMTQRADLTLGQVTSPMYTATSTHWPDEVASGDVLYPHRFGFVPLGQAVSVPLGTAGPLREAAEGLRRAAVNNAAVPVSTDVTDLLTLMGVSLSQQDNRNRAHLLGTSAPRNSDSSAPPPGQGRASDTALRLAVEQHAVLLAKEFMKKDQGWTHVKELGKPFDLVCTKGDGSEKHVEVKGTTGAGGSVEYTINEVDHFRTCPDGADLIVVRDIQVDRTTSPYTATGGQLLHIANYKAPEADLQPVRFEGRVEGW